MATTTFVISKSEIKDDIERECSLAIRNVNDENGVSAYPSLYADKESAAMLDGVWNESIDKLRQECREFVVSVNKTDSLVTFQVSGSYDLIADDFRAYIYCCMTDAWLQSCNVKLVDSYADRKQTELDKILRMLYYREPPV